MFSFECVLRCALGNPKHDVLSHIHNLYRAPRQVKGKIPVQISVATNFAYTTRGQKKGNTKTALVFVSISWFYSCAKFTAMNSNQLAHPFVLLRYWGEVYG